MKRTLVCLLLASLMMLSSCTLSLGEGGIKIDPDYKYPDAASYTAGGGEHEETITALSVNWVMGSVRIAYHDKDTVSFTETANNEMDEAHTLHYRFKDGGLTIQFAACSARLSEKLKKDLTVYLPKDTCLSSLHLALVASDASVDVEAETVDIDSVSGDLTLNASQTEELTLKSVSGRMNAAISGKLQSLKCDTVSGDLSIKAEAIGDFEGNTVSGNVELQTDAEPGNLRFNAVSGDLILNLPSDSSLRITMSTVSGKCISDLPMKRTEDEVVVGEPDDARTGKFNSISGNLHLRAKEDAA